MRNIRLEGLHGVGFANIWTTLFFSTLSTPAKRLEGFNHVTLGAVVDIGLLTTKFLFHFTFGIRQK
jgi:hypothetical protein